MARWLALTMQDRDWVPWAGALGIVVGGTLFLAAVRALIHRRLSARAPLTPNRIDDLLADLVRRTSLFSLMSLATLAAVSVVVLPSNVARIARDAASVVCLIQAGVWASRTVREVIERRFDTTAGGGGKREDQPVIRMATLAIRLALWAILILVALDNLGINVTALITGLGVGGIAIALATQNILGDIFASVSILIDKPFVLGDFISIDDYMGTVEQIGVKTTRVRALSGEQIVFANSDLLKSRLRNYKTQRERRVVFRISVAYETPAEKVQAIPGMLRATVEAQKTTRFDRAHLVSLGESALLYEVVYWVMDGNYAVYMDIQQAINLEIHRKLGEEGVAFAFPTRTLHVHSPPPQS